MRSYDCTLKIFRVKNIPNMFYLCNTMRESLECVSIMITLIRENESKNFRVWIQIIQVSDPPNDSITLYVSKNIEQLNSRWFEVICK